MTHGMSDWKYAGITALMLLGVTAFIVFVVRPGGFEGQIGWFFGLLPGAFVGATVAERLYKISPLLSSITYSAFIFGGSLLWYFVISYFVIKTYRLVSSFFN
jgi:hypothetical protein